MSFLYHLDWVCIPHFYQRATDRSFVVIEVVVFAVNLAFAVLAIGTILLPRRTYCVERRQRAHRRGLPSRVATITCIAHTVAP
jgi:hypothetical protein